MNIIEIFNIWQKNSADKDMRKSFERSITTLEVIKLIERIAELEAHNNYLLNECNIFTDKALAEIKADAVIEYDNHICNETDYLSAKEYAEQLTKGSE